MIRQALAAAIIVTAGWAQDVPASFLLEPQQRAAAASRENTLYEQGTQALDERRWQDAVGAFSQVAALKGRRADAALYWKAYALNKAGRNSEAAGTIAELRKAYPQSRWIKDAGALELEVRQSGGQRVSPEATGDEELKLLALNNLMHSDDETAIPMLEKFLASNNSMKLKERALFILAQSKSPRAQQIIVATAKGQGQPALQRRAIEFLGIEDRKGNREALVEVYNSSADPAVKRAVLQAFLVADAEQQVLTVAQTERNTAMRREAVRVLGAMNALPQLRQMYQSTQSLEDKKVIIEALGVADDVDTLAQIARTDPNPAVRIAGIRGLQVAGGKKTRDILKSIYAADQDPQVKRAAIEALFVEDDSQSLIEMARTEQNPALRRQIIERLSMMDDKAAKQFMLDLLNK